MTTLDKTKLDIKLSNIIDGWIEYLSSIRGYGINTLNAYQSDVFDFMVFCNNNSHNNLSPDKYILRDYLFDLSERNLSRTTVARRISCLKNFFKFLLKQKKNIIFRYIHL